MPIQFHPEIGTILICDFEGLKSPEMIKRRPVVVVSPKFKHRASLCTVVPLSTTAPPRIEPYHHRLTFSPPLPAPYDATSAWVKADMLYTVAFIRLSLPFSKKNHSKREYDVRVLDQYDLIRVRECVLYGLGLSAH